MSALRVRSPLFVAAAVVLAVLSASPAAATPGRLDRTFGDEGRVVTDFTRANDTANDVAVQANGKIVAVGRASTRRFYGRFAVARYRTNGHLDPAFGGDGRVTTNFVRREDAASAVAIQADGNIVVVGGASVTARDGAFALARYRPDGTLDASFGDGGRVMTNVSSGGDSLADVSILDDGRIVVAGTVGNGKFAAARYHPDGRLDDTFDGDGLARTDVATGYDSASALAVDANGNVLVAGTAGDGNFAVVRFTTTGGLDTTFDGDGKATTDLTAGYDSANALVIDADGAIVVAGEAGFCCEYTGRFALVRYEADGTPDATFGTAGVVITDFTPADDSARDVTIQGNGKIVAVGSSGFDGSSSRFALARYTSSGALDPNFGGDGRVTTAFSKGFDSAAAVALQADGRIVVAGGSYPNIGGLNGRFALARYGGGG